MPVEDFKPVTYTAKELELIDLALDSMTDGIALAKYQAHRQQCLLERYHRRNPEWREQFRQAHAEKERANKRYWKMHEELISALGHEVANRLDAMLDKGEDPFA